MRRRFNLSFWCLAYSIFLMVMMVLSLIFTACAYVGMQIVQLWRSRFNAAIHPHNQAVAAQTEDSAQSQKLTLVSEEDESDTANVFHFGDRDHRQTA